MSAPSSPPALQDHQYSFLGVTLGHGTPYMIESIEGLFDATPNLRSDDFTPLDRHGLIPGFDLLGDRQLNVIGHLIPGLNGDSYQRSDLWTLLVALQSVLRPRQTSMPFYYKLPGMGTRYLWARPRKSPIAKNYLNVVGRADFGFTLSCYDPVHYETQVHSSSTVGISIGKTKSARLQITCGGNWPNKPIVVMSGKGHNLTYRINSQPNWDGGNDENSYFCLSGLNYNGQIWSVDMRNTSMQLSGSSTRAAGVVKSARSEWTRLFPGTNEVQLLRDQDPHPVADGWNNNTAALQLLWQNAWMY